MKKEDCMYDGSDLYTLLGPPARGLCMFIRNVVMKL